MREGGSGNDGAMPFDDVAWEASVEQTIGEIEFRTAARLYVDSQKQTGGITGQPQDYEDELQ